MKLHYLAILLLSTFLSACGEGNTSDQDSSKEEEQSKDTLSTSDDIAKNKELYYDVATLLEDLPEASFPQSWDTAYLEKMELETGFLVDGDAFQQWVWLLDDKEIYKGSDPLSFFWKRKIGSSFLICFSTNTMFANGGQTQFYLALIQKDEIEPIYHLLDMIDFASIKFWTEGSEYILADITQGGKLVKSYDEPLKIFQVTEEAISLDQSLVSVYQDDYMQPQKMKGKLKDVVNNIDFLTYVFETAEGEVSFNHMTGEFIEEGKYFMEDTSDTESMFRVIKVNPAMQKEWVIRYEKVYTQEYLSDDYAEVLMLTGLAESVEGFEKLPKRKRAIKGKVTKVFKNDAGGFEILLKERDSQKEYVFVVPSGMFAEVKENMPMHFTWKWESDASKEESRYVRMLTELL